MSDILRSFFYSLVVVDTSATADQLVETLLKQTSIVTFSNAKLTGDSACAGIYTQGKESYDGLNKDNGIVLSTGNAADLPNQDSSRSSTAFGAPKDTQMQSFVEAEYNLPVPGYPKTGDACVLEFDFVCEQDPCPIVFNYIFGSEEYSSSSQTFNDAFAWFLNDKNIALLPADPNDPYANENQQPVVNIKNVNANTNSRFYKDNNPNASEKAYPHLEANGFTTVLQAIGLVNGGETNHMKMVITDVADIGYDSWVMLEAESFGPDINPCEVGCGKPQQQSHKVEVCHHASNANQVTICIDRNALEKHLLLHGDFCGKCPGDEKRGKSSLGDSGAMSRIATVASALAATAAAMFFME